MRRFAQRRPVVSNTTVSLPVTATGVGTQAANFFSGWTTPTTAITSVSQYGATALYIGNLVSGVYNNLKFIAKTSGISRDHEFTGWFARGRVFIRLTDAGRCFGLEHNANTGSVNIFLTDGIVEGAADVGQGTAGVPNGKVILFDSASAPISNYNNTATSGAYFTFGADGFEIYAAYNGVEFFRYTTPIHCEAGRIALTSRFGEQVNGFRDVTVVHKVSKALYSNPTTAFFDMRDFGIRPSVSDIGSITAGSTSLTVSDGTLWRVGDYIIVKPGNEANYGAFSARGGTRGVGGQWPTQIYNTVAQMNLDTTQVVNKIAGVLETGRTYRWSGSSWSLYDGPNYYKWIAPRALLAKVTEISGNVLTLDTPATVSATGATVYQNAYKHYHRVFALIVTQFVANLTQATQDRYLPAQATLYWAAGTFAWGSTVYERLQLGDRWTFKGAGRTQTTIVSPEGTTSLWLEFSTFGKPAYVSDINFIGLCRIDKPFVNVYAPSTDEPQNTQGNISLYTSTGGIMSDYSAEDMGQAGGMFFFSTDCWMRRVTVRHNTGFDAYFQWQIATVNCTNCGAEDIVFDFAKITPGIESFQSSGTIFRRISGRNANVSSNSNASWLYEEFDLYWEEDSLLRDAFPKLGNFLIDINSNASNTNGLPTTDSGTFRNFRLRQLGILDTFYNHTAYTIGMSGGTGANILGVYPQKPAATLGGIIEVPDNPNPGTNGNIYNSRNVVIRNDSIPNVVVDGVRLRVIEGTSKIGGLNAGSMPATMIVRNSVVDVVAPGGSQSNNMTNAAYDAL